MNKISCFMHIKPLFFFFAHDAATYIARLSELCARENISGDIQLALLILSGSWGVWKL